jgi:dienelactone hydrolase
MRPRGVRRPIRCLWIALLCLAALMPSIATPAAEPGPAGEPTGFWREQIHWVPMRDASGSPSLLYTRVCRPIADTPARVVLISHGTPADSTVRPDMHPPACESEAARWFLTRGYLVVAGMRRGYGETGGFWADQVCGTCSAEAYAHAGLEGARDIDALVTYATALPYARQDGVVVVGQSAGGWAADAYNSLPHPKVIAMVSMAGGRGGHWHNQPNSNCRPEELARAAGLIGAAATTPMLWVYTANDSYFAPEIAIAMHAAFTRSGGLAELIRPAPFDGDGHRLFFGKGGSAIWGPVMQRYLASRGAIP